MPQQTESATRTTLAKVSRSKVGEKIRVAGKVFAYDGVTGIALLVDGKCGVLVDVRNALDGQSTGWAKERLSKVEAIGYLEVKQHVYPVSPPWSTVDPQLVLDAVLVVAAPELDLTLWNAVVAGLAQ